MTTGAEHRRVILALWLLAVALLAGYVLAATRVVTDMSQFLPQGASPGQAVLLDEIRKGAASRALLLGISGGEPQQLAAAADALRGELEQSGYFTAVHNGRRSISPRQHPLLYQYRYVLAGDAQDYSVEGLRRALLAQLDLLQTGMSAVAINDPREDPGGTWLRYLNSLMPVSAPNIVHGVWFSHDRSHALLLARTSAAAFDMTAQQQVLDDIRARFAANSDCKGLSLSISGPALFALQSREIISREATMISLLSTLLVMGLLLLVFRRASLVLLSAVPLLTGVLAAVAVVTLSWGDIHGITLAFGITVIGVAVDYPLHLFMHKRRDEEPVSTLRRIWPVLRLGLLTTVTGYLAMLLSGFSGLTQLGLFAITGLAVAVLVTRLVLPTLMSTDWHVQTVSLLTPPAGRPAAALLLWLVFAAALVVVWQSEQPWQQDIAALNPGLAQQKSVDDYLRSELGAPDTRHFILVRGPNAEHVLQATEQLTPLLDGLIRDRVMRAYQVASRFLPSVETQRRRFTALPTAAQLRDRLREAGRGLPFAEGAFEPFVAAVSGTSALPPLFPADVADTLIGEPLQGLLFSGGEDWYAVLPLTGIADYGRLQAAVDGRPGLELLDLKAESSALLNAWRERALMLLAAGAVIILFMLWAGTRSLSRSLQIAMPVVAAVIVTVALLLLSGEALSLFHLASLLLVTGIGLDYSLFFHTPEADGEQARRSLQAILLCAVTTLLVFGILALARTPVLHAIGMTVAIGTLSSLVYTLFSTGIGGQKSLN